MSQISTIAAFDFDGTLTYRDTLLPFLFYTGGASRAIFKILLEIPWLIQYSLGGISRQRLKERFLKNFFLGFPKRELTKIGEKYAKEVLPQKLKPHAMDLFQWHKNQGHRCILVSANLDVYLEPWAAQVGFDDVICTKVAVDKRGIITGAIEGLNCWGPEKARRLEHLLGPKNNYLLYAYGDSAGDYDMLMLADYPFYCVF